MGFPLVPRITRELWKEWELRLLILLSLFLQLTLATQGSRRKFTSKTWIQFLVWTTYLLAEAVAILMLGVLSNRLANIKETKGTLDPQSQITAFWAPFLLLHLGGPNTITAFALADNELWLRHLARFCVKVGLACYIYYMALSVSTLSLIAKGMILVGFVKYAERTLCLYLASKNRLQDSMRPLPDFGSIYPRKMEQCAVKRAEGYQVRYDEVTEFSAREGRSVSGQEKALVKAYELFKIFKPLFVELILNSGDLAASKRIFKDPGIDSVTAFRITEIELGFMYDLLYTKAPLLNCAWGIIRWVIFLFVPCAVLILFSLKDQKDYPKVDIYITFLLVSMTILLEIYSLLLAISSDWVEHWHLQKAGRSTISSAVTSLRLFPNQRLWNSVAQFSLLRFSSRKGNRIFRKHPRLTRLDEKVEKNFYIGQKEFKKNIKAWIFRNMEERIKHLEDLERWGQKSMLEGIKQEAKYVLKSSNRPELEWSVEMEFDQSILLWHIATELCYYEDRDKLHGKMSEDLMDSKMSKLISRYMLYLLVVHPSMLPTGIGSFQYEDTLVDAQKVLEDKPGVLSKKEGCISSVIKWAKNYSRGSQDLCKVCHLLLNVRDQLSSMKTH